MPERFLILSLPSSPPPCGRHESGDSCEIFHNGMYTRTFINLMEDANFLIKGESASPSSTESIHN